MPVAFAEGDSAKYDAARLINGRLTSMKTDLTQAQIDQYRRDGFIHIPGFLNADEVAELRQGVLEAVEQMGRHKLAGVEGDDAREDGDDYYDRVFTQRLNLWRINDTVKRYMVDPELGRMLCQFEGIDGVRVWHDQALIKEPFGNPTAWHLDNPFWSFSSRHALSIWIALEPATLANGCMWFVPGSHKLARFDNKGIDADMAGLFRIYPQMAEIDPLGVPMEPGDCSFHNGLTAHGAGANMTRSRRIAMTCAYMPEGATYNGRANILPEAYRQTLTEGEVLENNQLNPKVYP